MARARTQAENHVTERGTPQFAEFGFWVSREDARGYAPWGIFTNKLPSRLFPMPRRVGWFGSSWNDRSVAEIFIHMHQVLPLSEDDIDFADEANVAVIAATRREVYCYDGR
jgi:hypothetical protein